MKFLEEINDIFLHNLPTFLKKATKLPSGSGALSEAKEKTVSLISSSENGLSNQILFSKLRDLLDQEENQAASELSTEYKCL